MGTNAEFQEILSILFEGLFLAELIDVRVTT